MTGEPSPLITVSVDDLAEVVSNAIATALEPLVARLDKLERPVDPAAVAASLSAALANVKKWRA